METNEFLNDSDRFVAGSGIGMTEGIMPMKKIFLDDGNQAVMACSKCFQAKTVSGADYKAVDGMVRIRLKCGCGASNSVVLERRKSFRKMVHLPGVMMSDQDNSEKPMTIQNLSVSGMGIQISEDHGVRIGDKITVAFKTGSGANHSVRKDAVIRHMEGVSIGVEFCGDLEDPDSQTICSLIFASEKGMCRNS